MFTIVQPKLGLILFYCFTWFVFAGILTLNSCHTPKITTHMETHSLPRLTVYTDANNNQIQLSYSTTDSLLANAAQTADLLPVLIGVLGINFNLSPVSSVLKMNGWDVPLTPIRMMEARSPYPIMIQPDEVGKLALVQGHFDGATVYQAKVIAVFEDEPITLLYKLLNQPPNNITPLLKK